MDIINVQFYNLLLLHAISGKQPKHAENVGTMNVQAQRRIALLYALVYFMKRNCKQNAFKLAILTCK